MRMTKFKFFSVLGLFLVSWVLCKAPSESYIRQRVVKLSSPTNMCSGEQVKAPSGYNYILTAAHCRILEHDGVIDVTKEDGTKLERRVIAEDPTSDLLLLEGLPGLEGITIASSAFMGLHVRTFTHGNDFATYKTDGYLVDRKHIDIAAGMIDSPEDEAKCNAPKFKIIAMDTFLGSIKICALSVTEVSTTALTVPGSSGGVVVDDSGYLVGVVSAGGDAFGWLVQLSDIKDFLSGY